MNDPQRNVTDDELHAFVDDHLAPERAEIVSGHLRGHPADADRVEGWRELNRLLHERFDPVLNEPVPDHLRRLPARRQTRFRVSGLAAGLALFVVGIVTGWFAANRVPGVESSGVEVERRLMQPAAMAHAVYLPEVRHPVEVTADQREHLVGWLSKRLGSPLRAPDLSSAEFQLIGGRLLPAAGGGPAAQFMYEDPSGLRLTLYLRVDGWDNQQTAFRFASESGLSVFYWIDGRFGYALVGEMDRDQLFEIARLVYRETSA